MINKIEKRVNIIGGVFEEIFQNDIELIKMISHYEKKGYEILKWKKKKVGTQAQIAHQQRRYFARGSH